MMMRSPTMADDLAASPLTSANVSSGRHDPYELNVKIMIAAVVVLLAVILFILALHLYAKWFWRSSHFGASRRLRNQDEQQRQEQPFVDDDPPFFNNPAFGLDKAFLDALPTFTFKQQQSEESEVESGKGKPQPDCCAVCISEFQEGDAGRMLPKCGHAFHTSCIDLWLHCHTTCPLCRTVIVSNPWESRAKADADAFDVRLLDTAVLEGLVLAAAVNNSGTSSASDEIGLAQGGGDQEQQVQHLVIEIPVVDSASTSSLGCCPQQLVPKSRWRSLRRMLSRECKVVPSGSSSPSTLSRTSSTNVTSSSSASAEAGECSEDQQQQLESGSNRYVVLLVE